MARTGAESVGEGSCEVAYLSDVDGDVGIKGTGCDCKGMPLVEGYRRTVDEEPLTGFVLHRGFAELDLDSVWRFLSAFSVLLLTDVHTIRMLDDFDNLSRPPCSNFSINALNEIQCSTN